MLTMLLDDKLFLAPIIANPEKVLDVGTYHWHGRFLIFLSFLVHVVEFGSTLLTPMY